MLLSYVRRSGTELLAYHEDDLTGVANPMAGTWFGNGSRRLALSGAVARPEFQRLCNNLHPLTGQRITGGTPPRA
jgi:hypothetical protein